MATTTEPAVDLAPFQMLSDRLHNIAEEVSAIQDELDRLIESAVRDGKPEGTLTAFLERVHVAEALRAE